MQVMDAPMIWRIRWLPVTHAASSFDYRIFYLAFSLCVAYA